MMNELELKVIEWAKNKGLLTNVTPQRIASQSLKVLEEIGETAGAILKNDKDALIDGIGDIYVTLIILAEMEGEKIIKRQTAYKDVSLQRIVMAYDTNINWALDMLFIVAENHKLKALECLQVAYDVISKRTGKMVGDTFVKD
jgi:NTP pyrophosphatase (non-canonical NTP hydrolase)